MRQFDFTPDPRVLLALTHTAMKPIDALCELIDNAIDSFNVAKLQGVTVENLTVIVDLPTHTKISCGEGAVIVSDNGPGMSPDDAERAIKAGFSGNNPYDSLGLFGMGFNISTGKLGNRTVVRTTRRQDSDFLETVIDLNQINRTKSYQLDVREMAKGDGELFSEGASGTIIEVDDWWPEGDANHNFVDQLVRSGMPQIRRELGRRYATFLREGLVKIIVNDEHCEPFKHCVWSAERYVTRGKTQIPARIDFDEVLGNTKRCTECTAKVEDGMSECPQCGATTTRTVPERIYGWVGIQRFDDTTDFGIDLIRNGRAIRKGEKAAFFEFTDEFQNTIKDYPIDGNYGRIVGEVHLDFVPVDFAKGDFQRTSEEWRHAMEFLRGTTSLQPSKTKGVENTSPIYQLYQGYRRVRNIGKGDMYMGTWDPIARKAKRVSREVEEGYYARFLNHEMGYYDDTEWWKLVEGADQPPAPKFKQCPECGGQNAEGAEECALCGHIFEGKVCKNPECGHTIPSSAASCPHCGTSQMVETLEPWDCDVCRTRNPYDVDECETCGHKRNEPSPVARESLIADSMKDDELSDAALSIALSNGEPCEPIKLETYVTNRQIVNWETSESAPLVVFKSVDGVTVFVDKAHPLFAAYDISVEQAVAYEAARYIFDGNANLQQSPFHTLSTLSWEIVRSRWDEQLKLDADVVLGDASALLDEIAKRMQSAHGARLKDYFELMSNDQTSFFTREILSANMASKTNDLLESGAYVSYAPPSFILSLYQNDPDLFFDDVVWVTGDEAPAEGLLDPELVAAANQDLRNQYEVCLDCVVRYMDRRATADPDYLRLVHYALSFLKSHMVGEHV